MNLKIVIVFSILILNFCYLVAQDNYLEIKPKPGDGVKVIFARYDIPITQAMLNWFVELNAGKFVGKDGLKLSESYLLPILVFEYNGKSIRSTIENNDFAYAESIQKYNDDMYRKGIKEGNYRKDHILWLPQFELDSPNKSKTAKKAKEKIPTEVVVDLFGEKYKNVKIISHKLKDCIFYIVSGHGGPDPGAVGYRDGYELHEDEYAYDVSLRLARNLIEHGAEVYVIVQDSSDGIRDGYYLNNSYKEVYIDGSPISSNQLERLKKRVDIINNLYYKNQSSGKKQYSIETHVDSRYTGKMIDIFFYHGETSTEGKRVADILLKTIEDKYRKAQPGRGYDGTVTSRNLYMIRNTIPTMIFIEIGNIQNQRDQIRLIEQNNRQAIANWLRDGLLNAIK
jgi:N-acetylmuramoyl-L-alanine amidase